MVEDMAPDFRGRTARHWAEMIAAWPQPFPDADAVLDYFGPVAGRYFLNSFTPGPTAIGCTDRSALSAISPRNGVLAISGTNGGRCGCPRC